MKDECEEFESKSALKIAKNNVEKYFAVVGILEKWQESLKLFEHFVPAYFKSAKQIYSGANQNDPSKLNKTNEKSMFLDENRWYRVVPWRLPVAIVPFGKPSGW